MSHRTNFQKKLSKTVSIVLQRNHKCQLNSFNNLMNVLTRTTLFKIHSLHSFSIYKSQLKAFFLISYLVKRSHEYNIFEFSCEYSVLFQINSTPFENVTMQTNISVTVSTDWHIVITESQMKISTSFHSFTTILIRMIFLEFSWDFFFSLDQLHCH